MIKKTDFKRLPGGSVYAAKKNGNIYRYWKEDVDGTKQPWVSINGVKHKVANFPAALEFINAE